MKRSAINSDLDRLSAEIPLKWSLSLSWYLFRPPHVRHDCAPGATREENQSPLNVSPHVTTSAARRCAMRLSQGRPIPTREGAVCRSRFGHESYARVAKQQPLHWGHRFSHRESA